MRLLQTVGDVVVAGQPLFEVQAQNETLLRDSCGYAAAHPSIVSYGF